MDNTLDQLEKYVTLAIVLLVPVAFLPYFPNAIDTIKLIILVTGVSLLLLIKTAKMVNNGLLEISYSQFDFPLLLIAVSYLLSAFLRTPNKMEAFFLPGAATIITSGILLYFLINQLKNKEKGEVGVVLFLSGVAVSLISMLSLSGLFGKIPQLAVINNPSFTTLGGNLPASLFFAAVIPLGLGLVINEKDSIKKIFFSVSLAIVTLGLLINIYYLLPGKPTSPKFPSWSTSWAVTVDALKESPILGIGPGNYITAFNRFRPLAYNQTEIWALRFTTARNFYLTLISESGFLGAAGVILLLLSLYRQSQKEIKESTATDRGILTNSKMVSLITAVLLLALFPSSTPLIVALFILLSLNAKVKKVMLNLSGQTQLDTQNTPFAAARLPAILVSLPILALVIATFFYGSRAVSAESTFKKSLDAVNQGNGGLAYDLMSQAINKNPRVDRYHLSFAQLNFALANSIATRAGGSTGPEAQKPEGEELTEEERATVTQLIQQAINEGKAAVSLNPPRAGNWEVLASLYRSIMAFAQGADQFAIQTYSQAVALDPINPNLRIALGGVHYALGNYDDAIDTFKIATLAKPDYANAHYNLAIAYRDNKNFDRAIAEMNAVLSLVDRDSEDYKLAKAELENIEAKKPAAQEELPEGSELTPPLTAEPVVEPPLELPEGAEPPEAPKEAEPSPTPVSSPTPTPTPQP